MNFSIKLGREDTDIMIFNSLVAGEELPLGQSIIQTSATTRLTKVMDFAINGKERTGYSTMGLIWGRAGLGKTQAIKNYANAFNSRAYTLLPPGVIVRVA